MIAASHILQLTENEEPTISTLYDTILQKWVAPLPADVPIRVRQRKERLARRIATEVMLASTRIRLQDVQVLGQSIQPRPGQDNSLSLLILPSRPAPGSPARSSQLIMSQSSLPSMSQPQSPSLQPAFAASTDLHPSVRLRTHLNIHEEDTGSPPVLPSSVKQLLAHWQPGTNPHVYDWASTEQALHSRNLENLSQENTEKSRKKKERRARKQRREDELMRTQPSSQPFIFRQPIAGVRSSPGPDLASSSQVPSYPLTQVPVQDIGLQRQTGVQPQTQTEPGRFGGRLDKKKKKKRVGGF
jgi:RNA polymerase I-specific transcription initiation factor RRN6